MDREIMLEAAKQNVLPDRTTLCADNAPMTRSAQPKRCVSVMHRPKARASGHVRLRTGRRCSTQPRSSAWTASLCSKPKSSARCPQWCSSNTMELHAVKVVPAYGDGHGLCSEA